MNDIALKCIELIFAFEQDNLDNTKIIVDYFNNLQAEDWQEFMNNTIDFINIINRLERFNNSIDHFIKNIKYFDLQQRLEWIFTAKILILNKSKSDIEIFLLSNINDIEEYQKPYLTQLCIISNRYDLLNTIRKNINNMKGDII